MLFTAQRRPSIVAGQLSTARPPSAVEGIAGKCMASDLHEPLSWILSPKTLRSPTRLIG
jgi:hypothetical protein